MHKLLGNNLILSNKNYTMQQHKNLIVCNRLPFEGLRPLITI